MNEAFMHTLANSAETRCAAQVKTKSLDRPLVAVWVINDTLFM